MKTRHALRNATTGLDATPEAAARPRRLQVDAHSLPLILLTVIAAVFVLDWAQAVFIPLVFGVLISYALSPLVDLLERAHLPRAIGAAIVLMLLVSALGALAYSLKTETADVIDALPGSVEKFRETLKKEWEPSKGTFEKVQKAATQIEHVASDTVVMAPATPRGVMRVQIEDTRFSLRNFLWNGTVGALALMSLAVMVLFLTYFLMVSGDTFRRKLVKLSGPTLTRKKITVQMLNEISSQIQRYLLVQVFASVIVGVATWLAFLALGLENAAVWGVAAAVLNAIPYLGAVAVTAGAALAGFIQFESLAMGLTVGGVALVINSLEGYLLNPWLTGRTCRMNAVVLFSGILFWGWLWGAWGLLLGLPIMMAIKSVCDHVEEFRPVAEFMGT